MKQVILTFFMITICSLSQAADVDVFLTDYTGKQEVGEESILGGKKTDKVSIFASPGEYEPFSFALQPRERIQEIMITCGALSGPGTIIPAENILVQSVEEWHGSRQLLMNLGKAWDMPAWSKELFWVTVKVPGTARPGHYKGQVTITSRHASIARLFVKLEVLPIKLEDPPFAMGLHYSWPGSVEALRTQLRDMRKHGMTNVGPLYNWHMPITDDDTSQLGLFLEEYLKAGYKQPVMFAAPMNLSLSGLTGYGPITSKRFQQKYIEVMLKLHRETLKHNIPVIFSIGDEFTNKGLKGVEYAGKLAKLTYEELPEICITSDCNGYMEVMAMAPYMNLVNFNNGWDGIDHHNHGRRLINEKFIREVVRKTDVIPYLVNAGKDRFNFGFFFWRMSKFGVRGKVEWYYCLGNNERGSLVRIEENKVLPTIDYERSREGIDDLKYICKLEGLIAKAKKNGHANAEANMARTYLKNLEKTIIPNRTAYSRGGVKWPPDGAAPVDPKKAAQIGSFNTIRRAIADHIVLLQNALR